MAQDQIPETPDEIINSVEDTVLQLWGDFVERLPFLVAAFAVVLAGWLAIMVVKRLMATGLRRSKLRESLQELLIRLVSIGLWILVVLIAAIIIFPGLTPAKALGAMGIVSIAVGFAFKDIFENFFAGILLLWRFPFERGDYIESQGIEGQIVDISVRMTVIRKTSGELVLVPNSFLFLNPVQVLTNLDRRRVTIIAGVAYGENVAEAVDVIGHAVRDCETVRGDQPVQIFPQAFGESSIDIEVTWWTGPKPVDIRRSRGEVVTAIKFALDNAGIEIPFPYRTLTFKEPLSARVSGLVKEDEA